MADVTGTRLHGLDVAVCSIDADVGFLQVFQNATIEMEVETQESRAVQDDFAYPRAKHKSWRMTKTLLVDTTDVTYPGDLQSLFAGTVTIAFDTGAGNYTGSGILRRVSHTAPDGGQTQDIEIVGQGPLNVA